MNRVRDEPETLSPLLNFLFYRGGEIRNKCARHLIDLYIYTDHNQLVLLSSPAEQNGRNYSSFYFSIQKNIFVIFQTKRFLFLFKERTLEMIWRKQKHKQYVYAQGSRSWMTSFSFVLVYIITFLFFSFFLSISFFGWVGTCLVCRFGTKFKDPRQVRKKKVSSSTRFSFFSLRNGVSAPPYKRRNFLLPIIIRHLETLGMPISTTTNKHLIWKRGGK